MHTLLGRLTDRILTKKGMYVTLLLWIAAATLLFIFAPSAHDFSDERGLQQIPNSSPSVIAQHKIAENFPDEAGFDGRLEFESDQDITHDMLDEIITDIQTDTSMLHAETSEAKIAENQHAAYLPVTFDEKISAQQLKAIMSTFQEDSNHSGMNAALTGPAGEAVNHSTSLNHISGMTVIAIGIVFVLLLFIFRPFYVALVPLAAAIIAFVVTDRLLGLLHFHGIMFAHTSLLFMGLLLIFLVIFYSVMLFAKYKEALAHVEESFTGLAAAMYKLNLYYFYTGIMLLSLTAILYTAYFKEYHNLMFILGIAVVIVHVAAFTLMPALFLLIPVHSIKRNKPRHPDRFWQSLGNTATTKPIHTAVTAGVLLIVMGILGFGIDAGVQQPQNTDGSFILQESFPDETFATEKLLLASASAISDKDSNDFIDALKEIKHIDTITLQAGTADDKVHLYEIALAHHPASKTSMNTIENMMKQEKEIIAKTGIHGEFFITGETAGTMDKHNLLVRDTAVMMIAEIVLLFSLLILLTRSAILSGILLGANLLAMTAALGLGSMLTKLFFNGALTIDTILYLFIFLFIYSVVCALCFIFRFADAKRHAPVPAAAYDTIIHTGGIVFSVCLTLSVSLAICLFFLKSLSASFGIIAIFGMLLYTIVVHGALMPSLLVLTEKNEHLRIIRRKKKKPNKVLKGL